MAKNYHFNPETGELNATQTAKEKAAAELNDPVFAALAQMSDEEYGAWLGAKLQEPTGLIEILVLTRRVLLNLARDVGLTQF